MAILERHIMTNPVGQSTVQQILQFIKDCLPMIGGIIAVWKTIDEVAKWYAKKQEAQLKALIASEVTPQINELHASIDRLTKMIGALEQKIK